MTHLEIHPDPQALGAAAARYASTWLKELLAAKETVRVIAATGAAQFAFLEILTQDRSIDWKRIELFHLDEYIGLSESHPASFARYIRERILNPTGIERYLLLDGTGDPDAVLANANARITEAPVDLAFVGIGENGHLAFNDPPADFDTEVPFLRVALDEACRRQQVGEGWFPSLEAVPTHAYSMAIRQILKTRRILCLVPDLRKAVAVRNVLEGPVSNLVPASILNTHPDTTLLLDRNSASLLKAQ